MNKKALLVAAVAIPSLVVAAIVIADKKGGNMKLSEKGANLIKQYEGLRLKAYQDAGGVWTIGYGHTAGVQPGDVITREEADALFWADVEKFVRGVNRLKQGTRLTQNQFDALVSFAYNCGLGALERSTLLKKVKRNPNDPTIEDAFKAYRYVNKVENAGLLARRQKESNLYFA